MSKYEVGDKATIEILGKSMTEYIVEDYTRKRIYFDTKSLDGISEPLSTYTEPLEAKIRRQAAEITRLLAENAGLKEQVKKLVAGFKETNKKICEACEHIDSVDKARAEGQNEAWELARKIASTVGVLSSSELVEIFNSFLPRNILSENTYPEAAAKVAEWEKAKKKPQKTMIQDFFEKFPNAELNSRGTPYGICPSYLGYKTQKCNFDCVECWNRPLGQIGGEE